jgi:hypothetical protein
VLYDPLTDARTVLIGARKNQNPWTQGRKMEGAYVRGASGDRAPTGYLAADQDKSFGRRRWAIAEGYIPGWSNGPEPQFTSHETVCLLNANDEEASVEITVYFADREPAGPYGVSVPARRTKHVRINEPTDPDRTDYASVISSDVPILVQHTRLDSRQAETALLSTIAYASDL